MNNTTQAFSAHKLLTDRDQFKQIALNNVRQNVGLEIIIQNQQMTGQPGDPEFYVQKIFEVNNGECKPFKIQKFVQMSEYIKNINGVHFIRKKILQASQMQPGEAIQSISGKQHPIQQQINTIQVHQIYQIDQITTLRLIISYRVQQKDPKIFMQEIDNIRSNILLKYSTDNITELLETANQIIVRIDTLQAEMTNQTMCQIVGIISGLDSDYVKIIGELNDFYEMAGFKQSIKQLLRNPRQIQKKDIVTYYPWNQAILSAKADGTHCLLMLGSSFAYILTEKDIQKHKIDQGKCNDEYIIEGELINNTIYCYDLHMAGSLKVFKQPYIQRLQQLKKIIDSISSVSPGGYKLQLKPYIVIQNDFSQEQIKQAFVKTAQGQLQGSPADIDGIMICTNEGYFTQEILKWKPASQLTIDFYVEKQPIRDSKQQVVDYVLYSYVDQNLFKRTRFNVMIQPRIKTDKHIILVPFQPSLCQKCYTYQRDIQQDSQQQIDGKVCEFKYDVILSKWVLYRIREDKNPQQMQFGNYFNVAEQVFFNIVNFINLESLYNISFTNQMYFQRKRPVEYDEMTKHMGLVKRLTLQSQLQRNSNILDLGCGQGQDIHKYATAGIANAIMVDQDIDALQELVARKNSSKNLQYPVIQAYNADLSKSQNTESLINKLQGQKINYVVCSFALHYFMNNIDNIAKICSMVAPGGKVFLFYMDGQRIFNLLKNTDCYQIMEKDKVKYEITKEYKENEFLDFGQTIQVKLPFADNPYQEPLMNTQFLRQKLAAERLHVIADFNFDVNGDYKLFKLQAHQMHESFNLLSTADKQWVSLYKCLVLQLQ